MKTLSFHEYRVGHPDGRELLGLDSRRDSISFRSGLNLVVAPNGFGKSTLFRSLAGMIQPLGGTARLDGEKLRPERDVLYVSEYLAFPKFVTPMEWIGFASGRSPEKGAEWLEKFRIAPGTDRYLGRMSQGERRKTTWIAAHLSGRPIILMDEPLDGLDLRATETARELLSEWIAEGRMVGVIAHQPAEVLDLAEAIFAIRDHRLVPMESGTGWTAESLRSSLLSFYSAG